MLMELAQAAVKAHVISCALESVLYYAFYGLRLQLAITVWRLKCSLESNGSWCDAWTGVRGAGCGRRRERCIQTTSGKHYIRVIRA